MNNNNNGGGGGQVALTAADIARLQNANFNAQNGTYDPEDDDELDETDSEFYDDSDYENDSELENEAAILHSQMQQTAANVYGPAGFHVPNVSVADANAYSALNALGHLSASMGPNFNMQAMNVTDANHHAAVLNALSQMQSMAVPTSNTQHHRPVQETPKPITQQQQHQQHQQQQHHQQQSHQQQSHPMLMNALSQMTKPSPSVKSPTSNVQQSQQRVVDSNHNAINAMNQMGAPTTHWQPQFEFSGHQPAKVIPTAHRKRDQNGNDDGKNPKQSTPIRTGPRTTNAIRRMQQQQLCRREVGVDLFQIRRMEFEETFTTDESGSSSPIKDITAKLKHLRLKRPNFLKIFQRNKSNDDNLAIISAISPSDLPALRDSAICSEVIQDEGKSQLQKISEVLLKPSDKSPIENLSSSYEKSIQAFLFRSNFPEHFLGIRLLKLSIDDVQQLIRQIDLLENVQDKLNETVLKESLSGPALMSCDLIELKKSLDLNLGHWTIFEQLITGLRQMQYDDFKKFNNEKPTNFPNDEIMTKHPERMSHENLLDDPTTGKSSLSSLANDAQKLQPIVENKMEETSAGVQ